jgi:predicted TIM-barrel fold metal-dependent hydrolase
MKKYPERLIGFCRVDPRMGKMAIKEVERSVLTLGLRGLKLHPIMEVFTIDHEAILEVIQHAADLNIPILIHSGSSSYDSAVRFSKLAEKVRNTAIIIGHFSSYPENVRVAKKHDNLYLETSGAVCPSQIADAVETIGAERILFGSDWPYLNIKFEMVKIEMADISKRDKELIFGRNAEKILH